MWYAVSLSVAIMGGYHQGIIYLTFGGADHRSITLHVQEGISFLRNVQKETGKIKQV